MMSSEYRSEKKKKKNAAKENDIWSPFQPVKKNQL